MPLIRGKSKEAFEHNLKAELAAGKPMKQSLAISYSMKKKAKKMAKGGRIEDNHQPEHSETHPEEVHEMDSGYVDHEGDDVKHDAEAMAEDDKSLNQHADEQSADEDMVSRIMKKRSYSKGGMVANGGEDDLDKMADGRPNNFDDLALRDDLESSYTGENSGDELGNDREDADREDIVSRIMRSRAKKDRLPNPR